MIRSKFTIDKDFLRRATQLKFIARSGSGLENIDMQSAILYGIKIFNSPEGNRNAVSEHALGMLLMLFNKLREGDAQVRKGIWNRTHNRGIELDGLTLGLIGYGNTGQQFSLKLSGFNVNILAYDKYEPISINSHTQSATLKQIQAQADIISLHVPLTKETEYLINAEFIDKCQMPFFLINTSRGKVVCTSDLVTAMKKGKIRGACLDVLEYESPDFSLLPSAFSADLDYLINSDRVILTPHVAGWTHESYIKLATILYEKVTTEFGHSL